MDLSGSHLLDRPLGAIGDRLWPFKSQLQPAFLEKHCSVGAPARNGVQHFGYKLSGSGAEFSREDESAADYVVIEILVFGGFKGEVSGQQCIKQNSAGSNVDWRSVVQFSAYYFRGHIAWSPTEKFDLFVVWN